MDTDVSNEPTVTVLMALGGPKTVLKSYQSHTAVSQLRENHDYSLRRENERTVHPITGHEGPEGE